MASRVDVLSAPRREVRTVSEALQTVVTPDIVDQAVENVLRGVPEERAAQLRSLWMSDTQSDVTREVQKAAIAKEFHTVTRGIGRVRVKVDYVMSKEEYQWLAVAYPEYEFEARPTMKHDHASGAMARKLDELDIEREIPPRLGVADFGGNLVRHVQMGNENVVSVRSVVDQHDAGRDIQDKMRLRVIATRREAAATRSVAMATSVLNGEDQYVARCTLQEFARKVAVGKMVHVYDVPMSELAPLMERCSMSLFLGAMHMSGQFYDVDRGLLPAIGARFEIDRGNDVFSMGFVGSSAKWYRHKWSELRHYGADQVLSGERYYFSYKIYKRRGDTIHFRILPVGPLIVKELRQVYTVPGVEVVVVDGYRIAAAGAGRRATSSRRFLEKKFVYPRGTWDRVVRAAAVEATKGSLDFNALVSIYRTQVAGLKYNGVSVDEAAIPTADVGTFIALAGVFGCAELALLRAGAKAFVASEMRKRAADADNVLIAALKALYATAVAVTTSPLIPFAVLFDCLMEKGGDVAFKLVQVRESVSVREVPGAAIVSGVKLSEYDFEQESYPFRDAWEAVYDDVYGFDSAEFAALERERAAGWQQGQSGLDDVVSASSATAVYAAKSQSSLGVPSSVDKGKGRELGGPPPWLPFSEQHGKGSEKFTENLDYHNPGDRVAAVQDAIEACIEEMDAVNVDAARVFGKLMVGGSPSEAVLREQHEMWHDADLWHVEKGVVTGESVLGRALEDFSYQAVYCPVERELDVQGVMKKSGLYAAAQEVSKWTDQYGVEREREYLTMEIEYTGYVLVNKAMLVYNGPEIVIAMTEALRLPHDYDGGTRRGGPGAGKTHTIRAAMQRKDVFASPLKISVEDFRKEMVSSKTGYTARTLRLVARTIDSYLVLATKMGTRAFRSRVGNPVKLWVDEVYAALPGRVYAVAALLGVSLVVALGDDKQIPAGVRATFFPKYMQVRFRYDVFSFIVYRGSGAVLATFNEHYGNQLRTVSKAEGKVERIDSLSRPSYRGKDVAVVCMYQDGKAQVKKMLPAGLECRSLTLSTVHEAQGKSVDMIIVVDPDPRSRTDSMNLHNDARYVNVALSRAKTEVYLVKAGGGTSLLLDWIEYGQDPRRARACRDLETVGHDFTALAGWV